MKHTIARMIAIFTVTVIALSCAAAAAPSDTSDTLTPVYPTGLAEHQVYRVDLPENSLPQVSLMRQTTLEETIYQGLKNKEESIDISGFSVEDDVIFEVYWDVVYSNPELFYIESGYSLGYKNGELYYILPSYMNSFPSNAQEIFDKRVNEILDTTITNTMSDLEKALALHDYLALHCDYDYDVDNATGGEGLNIYNAYGALVEGNAVCQGYALAYNLLLQKAGLEARYISSDTRNHAWSLVEIDEAWYHVDVTFDDPLWESSEESGYKFAVPGYVHHNYFLLSTDTLLKLDEERQDMVISAVGEEKITCSDKSFESGYIFNNAATSFTKYYDAWYYLGQDAEIHSTGALTDVSDATKAMPVGTYYTTLRSGDQYYFRQFRDSETYCYDLQTRELTTDVAAEAAQYLCGLDELAGDVWIVRSNITEAGFTRIKKFSGVLTLGNPVVNNSQYAVDLENGTPTDTTIILCLASYDAYGCQVGVDWTEIELDSGEEITAILSPASNAASAKVLYLSSNYAPLRDAAAIPISIS